ncbi:hypothetical protein BXZ70DRAFT_894402 [Cristinia sonorae]|uniref:DUF4246 domain-containing protein n=1 Tax=Cristinia sonorae TaxID=1940300 RepID=A0A8K0XP74_9AGAR|nr:hypothetical protein BXZ70DRAFT_894402 [Cristinia sonorae]
MEAAPSIKPWSRGYLHPFWDGSRFWYGVGEKPRTLTELGMCSLSAELRSVETWWMDRLDERTRAEWISLHAGKRRIVSAPCGPTEVLLDTQQVEYVIDELAGYASLRDEMNECQVSCFERIWESTSLFSEDFLATINSELDSFRRTGTIVLSSDHLAHDIINPYHCPVRYNVTLKLSSDKKLRPIPPPNPLAIDRYTLSSVFASLPTEFTISPPSEDLACHALGYINNIHPSHKSLYSQIEAILAKTIPLFEHVLTDLHRDNPLPQRIKGSCKYTEWDEPEEPEHSDDEDGWARHERELRTWVLQRPISIPDIPLEGYTGGLEDRRTLVSLRGMTVKVLVKVTDITLTSEKSEFPGDVWEVAGMRNEQIVACALHCISSSNITAPKLVFRMPICSPRRFMSGDEGATIRTWGLRHNSPSNQFLGGVPLSQGCSVAFPNIYQHALESASLIDVDKEGSLTILGLFLVDPELCAPTEDGPSDDFEILSTSTVPPQQKAWYRRALEECLNVRIPNEIIERIVDSLEGVMTEKEAQEVADSMRRDREWFRLSHARCWFNLPFDVWSGEYRG